MTLMMTHGAQKAGLQVYRLARAGHMPAPYIVQPKNARAANPEEHVSRKVRNRKTSGDHH